MNARRFHRTTALRRITYVVLAGLMIIGLALAVAPLGGRQTAAHGTTVTAIPKGATGYRYKVVVHNAELLFHTVGYAETGFSNGQAGFGSPAPASPGRCPFNNSTEVKTVWPLNTDILVRKTFTLPPTDHAHNMRIVGTVDNAATVYLNGIVIAGPTFSSGCVVNGLNLTVPDNRLLPGENLLAIRGFDNGVVSFLDVQVVYDAVNTQPVAANDTAGTNRKNPVTIAVLANDADGDGDPLQVRDLVQPAHGSVVPNADGTVTYTPNRRYKGIDTFTYVTTDGALDSDTATVSVEVVNASPVSANDTGSTSNDTRITIPVLANDGDDDADDLSVSDLTQPLHGSVEAGDDGAVTFTPSDRHAGTETFTYRASDGLDVSEPATVSIAVSDDTPPALSDVPDDQVLEATGPDGAGFAYDPLATDLVDGDLPVDCSPSRTQFPLGSTTVECTAEDAAGNTASRSFTVTVRDRTAPEFGNVQSDEIIEATGPDGAAFDFAPSATDLVDGDVDVACTPPAGSMLPVGTTRIDCTAVDDAGNGAATSFSVTVTDANAPVLLLDDVSAEATGPDGATVSYEAAAEDEIDGAVTPDCAPASGSLFPLGTTTVDCTAADSSGNETAGSFDVTVEDTTSPNLTVPADISVKASGATTTVTYAFSASDTVSGSIAPVCSLPSGSPFPAGTTMVSCTATDAAGNESVGQFTVTVTDGKKPKKPKIIVPDDRVVRVKGPATGAVVKFRVAAHDGNGASLQVTCTPPSGSTFALGKTRVVCQATDSSGTTVSGKFTVTVKTTPPTTKRQCRDRGWKNFAAPSFESERECIRYVEKTRGHDDDRDRGNDRDDKDKDRDKKRDRD